MQGHSREEVHNARSIGGHTHETAVDAGVVDDSHPAHGSRVTAAGGAGGWASDWHVLIVMQCDHVLVTSCDDTIKG